MTDIIFGHPILSALTDNVRQNALHLFEIVDLKRHSLLQDFGYPDRHAYFIDSGLISISVKDGDRTPVEAFTIGAGDMLGQPHLLQKDRSPFRSTVQVPGRALRIGSKALSSLVERDSGLNSAVLNALGTTFVHGMHLVACNARHSVRQRIARWLLLTSDQVSSNKIDVTHQTIAHALGVRRPGVTDELGDFERQKIVLTNRGSILLRDRHLLEGHACDCYHAIRSAKADRRSR